MKTHDSFVHDLLGMSPVQELIRENRKTISQKLRTTARENALNYKVYSGACPLNLHADFLITAYQVVYSKSMALLKPDLNRKYGYEERIQVKDLNLDMQKRINKLESLNESGQEDADPLSMWVIAKFGLLFTAFIAIYLGELLLLASAVMMLGKSLLFSLLISATISASLIMLVQFVPAKINQMNPRLVRIIARICFATFFLFVFYTIGKMRSDYVQIMNGSQVSAWQFASLNLLAFVGQYYLVTYCLQPLFGEVRRSLRAFNAWVDRSSRNREIRALETTKKSNEAGLVTSLKSKLFLLDEADALPGLLNAMLKEDFSEYKKIYVDSLPDASFIPECFYQSLPDITFTSSAHTEYAQL